MSVRQRLSSKFQDREASRTCWHCTLGALRSHRPYTSPAISDSLLKIGDPKPDGFAALSHEIGQRLLLRDLRGKPSHPSQRQTFSPSTRRAGPTKQVVKEQRLGSLPNIKFYGSDKHPCITKLADRLDAAKDDIVGTQRESWEVSEHRPKATVKTASSAGPIRPVKSEHVDVDGQTIIEKDGMTDGGQKTEVEGHANPNELSRFPSTQPTFGSIHGISPETSAKRVRHSDTEKKMSDSSTPRKSEAQSREHGTDSRQALSEHPQADSREAYSLRMQQMNAHLNARVKFSKRRSYTIRKHAVHSKRDAFRKYPALQDDWLSGDSLGHELSKDDVKQLNEIPVSTLQREESSVLPQLSSASSKARLDRKNPDDIAHSDLDAVLNSYRDLTCVSPHNRTTSPPTSFERVQKPRTSSIRRAADQYYNNVSLFDVGGPAGKRCASTSAQRTAPSTIQDRSIDPLDSRMVRGIDDQTIRERLRSWRKHQVEEDKDSAESTAVGGVLDTSKYMQNIIAVFGEDDVDSKILREDDDRTDQRDLDLHNDPVDINSNPSVYLKKGDMVAFETSSEPILAMFVRNLSEQSQFYTEQGQWLHRSSLKVQFAVSGFSSAEELDDIVPFLPSEDVASQTIGQLQPIDISAPRGAGAGVVRKMQDFHLASDDVFRQHADRLARAYELIAPQDYSSGRRFVTLENIAIKVLQKTRTELTPAMLWAVHRTLCQAQNVVPEGRSNYLNPTYEIMPIASLADIDRVRDWTREYQESESEGANEMIDRESSNGPTNNPLRSFIAKARTAIRRSRANRGLPLAGGVGPSLANDAQQGPDASNCRFSTNEKLSDSEKMIIHYLDAWVTSRYLNPKSNLKAIGPMILRAVAMYKDMPLDERTGFTFLQELGIVKPWENRTVYRPGTRLPGHHVHHPTTTLHEQARLALSGFQSKDSMADKRRDWGDLAVFCIDSADALERDDGVSLQAVTDDPSSYWIHVHVANPSAFIAPDSAFARYAANLSESVYLPEHKYPMLEPLLTKAYFGLGQHRPCITFSAKVNARGEMIEKEISHGTIHNVHYATPERISKELKMDILDDSDATTVLIVGSEILETETSQTRPEADRNFSLADVEALSKLRELGEATRHRRERNGSIAVKRQTEGSSMVYPEVCLSQQPDLRDGNMSTHLGLHTGDPVITIKRSTHASVIVSDMVADLMILAGEVAAQWSKERNLPIPYRGIARNPEPYKSPEVFRSNVLNQQIERQGYANLANLITFMKLMGSSIYSASPLEHTALGLAAYSQVTSPLRRYADLFTHWQIEAALRHETQSNADVAAKKDSKPFAFSYAHVDSVSTEITARKRNIRSLQLSSQRHWITQALFRAFYFKQAQLPQFFKVVISHLGVRGYVSPSALIDGWGTVVQMLDLPLSHPQGSYKVGERWQAKISSIDPYYSRVFMEPVMLT